MDASDLTTFLTELAKAAPAVFDQVMAFAENYEKQLRGPSAATLSGGQAPAASDNVSGRNYTLQASAIRDEDKAKLRQGLSDGIAIDRMVAYIQGVIAGISLAGGAA